ncbi:unnamed protein product [Mesocestoides corti]|uniref:Eukaryotic translation initiation factor 3 30 kDa subunit n=1 Tax=Mesocestoides corti TaxID=53468 RepID=A0A0R3UE85_MESCO|nr:unnamed protein product [Mesocestoides corti]
MNLLLTEDEIEPKKLPGTWEDEEDVPETWDDELKPKEDSKPKSVAPPKASAKQKIAAKREKKSAMIAEFQKKQEESGARQLTELEREELNKEQECVLIMDSFGVADPPPQSSSQFDVSKVSTKQDFIDLSNMLVEKFKKLEVILRDYFTLRLLPIIRNSQKTLSDRFLDLDDLKDLSTSINALITEKQKLVKTKTKKKSVKTKLVVERSINDLDFDENGDDDFDDFL